MLVTNLLKFHLLSLSFFNSFDKNKDDNNPDSSNICNDHLNKLDLKSQKSR